MYQALNLATGDLVAVKRLELTDDVDSGEWVGECVDWCMNKGGRR